MQRLLTPGNCATASYRPLASPLFVTSDTRFDADRPFAFRANADGASWDPETLERRLEVRAFGLLHQVNLDVTGQNTEDVVRLATSWTEAGIPVVLFFPAFSSQPMVGTVADPLPFGMDADECYERMGRLWVATAAFVREVAECFSDDPKVHLEPRLLNRAD